ncbi:hypothetical protein HGQ85_16510 [Clostridioides difficile]|nr:hypothetical protein [Clostridioides difficile]
MKKLLVILLCLIVSIGLVACSSDLENDLDIAGNEDQTDYSSNESSNSSYENSYDSTIPSNSENDNLDNSQKNQEEKIEASQFFNAVYIPSIYDINKISFDTILGRIKNTGYKYDVVEPNEDTVGKINVYDSETSDTVHFLTYPNEYGVEALALLEYDSNGKSVSVDDKNHEGNIEFDPSGGIDAQIEFLFGNE